MQIATATKPPKVYVAVKADFAADGTDVSKDHHLGGRREI